MCLYNIIMVSHLFVAKKPYQPCHLSFPAHQFGKAIAVHKSFQLVWYNRFKTEMTEARQCYAIHYKNLHGQLVS